MQAALRDTLLSDDRLGLEERFLASQLLLHIDDPQACWQACASWLLKQSPADRVDAGYVDIDSSVYVPVAEHRRNISGLTSILGTCFPLQDSSVQFVFRQAGPVVFEDTLDNPHIEPELARFFQQVGTRSKMAIAIRDGGQIVGLLCLDHSRPQAWDLESRSRVQVLASLVIGPVLGAARNLTVATPHEAPEATTASPLGWEASSIERLGLTPAECRVAQWVMQGYSYKEVARHLNRSASTIDHQLRSLRQKLGVTSTAKLVQALHQLPVPPR